MIVGDWLIDCWRLAVCDLLTFCVSLAGWLLQSLTLNLNPLFFMFPAAITTSFAFMLPVATPPNAIVFAFGAVRVIDMVSLSSPPSSLPSSSLS